MNGIGQRLKEARERAGKSRAEVQALFGYGPTAMSEYEGEKTGISDRRLLQLADLYGISPEYLAGRPVLQERDDAFYDGIIHALAAYNRVSGELLAEVQQWRSRKTTAVSLSSSDAEKERGEAVASVAGEVTPSEEPHADHAKKAVARRRRGSS